MPCTRGFPLLFAIALFEAPLASVAQTLSLLPPTAVTATTATFQWAGISAPLYDDWVAWYCVGEPVEDFGYWDYVDAVCPSTYALGACSNVSWAVAYATLGCTQIGE